MNKIEDVVNPFCREILLRDPLLRAAVVLQTPTPFPPIRLIIFSEKERDFGIGLDGILRGQREEGQRDEGLQENQRVGRCCCALVFLGPQGKRLVDFAKPPSSTTMKPPKHP
ncbi:hypothetical protein L2E82_11870 [Cichorium intybus]|uniref:Uncharacterized protein n=1 Tax=Cichorium intybus TaxID=13427 RepID=A0ACB9GEA2_CICIN|nr:hypothetical protein L2E82_11870 [Cichorium intybus]